MKITLIETFLVDGGWRPWAFVKVSTDEGLVGWGEATCFFTQHAVLGAIEDMKSILIGSDPRAFEMRFWEMYRASRLGSVGGAVGKAIGALDCAMIDIAAKAAGQSVAAYFGGPMRTEVPLYWSHLVSSRMLGGRSLGLPPIRTLDDVAKAAAVVPERGFRALKTNLVTLGEQASINHSGYGGGPGTTDQVITTKKLAEMVKLVETIRNTVGSEIEIILDLNFNCKPEAATRIARALQPFELAWIEIDSASPQALRQLRDSIETPICSSETLFYMEQYLPYFEARCQDIVMIDVIGNGFSQAKKVGELAQLYQLNICPHNFYSHLASFISANLAAVLPNVRIMEYEVEDVPWKDELVSTPPVIERGSMKIPTSPGWGTEPDEAALRARRWGGNARTSVSVAAGGLQFEGFNNTIMTLFARGRTVAEIQSHISETHNVEVTAEFVNFVTGQVMHKFEAWQSRRLDARYMVVYLDSITVQIASDAVQAKNAYWAVGVRGDGSKDVLGIWIGDTESKAFWKSIATELHERGVREILLLCTDTRVGLAEALGEVFEHHIMLTRVVDMVRSSVAFVPLKERRTVFDDLRDVYAAPNARAAEEKFEHFVETWGPRYPIIPPLWQTRWDEITALQELPVELRSAIGATKLTEPLHRQINNVVKAHGYLTDDRAALKLIYLAIYEATQDWGKKDAGWEPAMQAGARYIRERMRR